MSVEYFRITFKAWPERNEGLAWFLQNLLAVNLRASLLQRLIYVNTIWALLDLNQRPTDYEPILAIFLRCLQDSVYITFSYIASS